MVVGLERQPARDVRNLPRRIVETGVEQLRRRRLAGRRVEDRRRRIERAQPGLQALARRAALRRVDEVGLAQDDAVGDGGLFDSFQVRVERGLAVDRVDHRDDAVEAVAHRQIRMRHRGLQHRRRIGQAGRLQDHPAERRPAVVEIAQQLLQRVDQVAAQRAAQAAALQQYDAVADLAHQQVIEADRRRIR